MATTFKNLRSQDIASTRTLLHEAIPVTGTICSGTYNNGGALALGSEHNIKTYGHGMFESVYDYPYLSSSANQIVDITLGFSKDSGCSGSSTTQNNKKINLYNQMAQYLVGYDITGSIKTFRLPTNNVELSEVYFLNFARLLSKDEIKKGSFTLDLGVGRTVLFAQGGAIGHSPFNSGGAATNGPSILQLTDFSGSSGYSVDSPAGEYGVLYATQSISRIGTVPFNLQANNVREAVGLIYYQAGVAVISGSVFNLAASGGILNNVTYTGNGLQTQGTAPKMSGVNRDQTSAQAFTGSTMEDHANGFRNKISNISFNNTTELNSTIYFCRVNHNDFNYSSNPTYLTGSRLRIKNMSSDVPVSYITTVGMYSADNELLAVAKLSEPLRKDPTNELTLRVRLDY